jgi:putative PIN family toxin of toxin-antitoxin system
MPPKPELRVFLDSDVIAAALYSAEGPAGAILEHFVNGKLMIIISQQVLEEVIQAINENLPEALHIFRRLLVSFPPEIVKNPSSEDIANWAQVIHSEDAAILAAAVAAQPDYLISGDNHFFGNPEIVQKSGLHILTPAHFLVLSSDLADASYLPQKPTFTTSSLGGG